jgi:hypothetical protein
VENKETFAAKTAKDAKGTKLAKQRNVCVSAQSLQR